MTDDVITEDGVADDATTDEVVELDNEVRASACLAARAADAKLGEETVVLDMVELRGVVDAFVITSGRNARQVRTLADEVELVLKETFDRSPRAVEGLSDATWVLMDYGDFVVHVFLDDIRTYYDLEHLWSSSPRIDWQEQVRV